MGDFGWEYPPGCNGPPDDPPDAPQEQGFSVRLTKPWLNLRGVREALAKCGVRPQDVVYGRHPNEFFGFVQGGCEDDSIGEDSITEAIEVHIWEVTGRDEIEDAVAEVEVDEKMQDPDEYWRGRSEAAQESMWDEERQGLGRD